MYSFRTTVQVHLYLMRYLDVNVDMYKDVDLKLEVEVDMDVLFYVDMGGDVDVWIIFPYLSLCTRLRMFWTPVGWTRGRVNLSEENPYIALK